MQMLNFQQQEEQKIRLPFIMAPQKPDTQQSCADNSGSGFLQGDEQIVIENQD